MRLVGKVKEAHGLRGELYVLIFSGDISWLPRLKEFGLGNCPQPGSNSSEAKVSVSMSSQKVKPFKKGFILKANDVGDRTAAEKLEKMGFYIPDELLVAGEGEELYLDEIMGFRVKDVSDKVLGQIVDFSSNGPQDLLVIEDQSGATHEIPFVDAFIRKVDFKSQVIKMDLPEGLLELSATEASDEGEETEALDD